MNLFMQSQANLGKMGEESQASGEAWHDYAQFAPFRRLLPSDLDHLLEVIEDRSHW